MNDASRAVQRIYLILLLLHTLAASLIWGINTLFLLDAGLDNAEAFAANAFFTAGLVLFEIPTGVIADIRGRRLSYLLGTLTLTISTLSYLWMWRVAAPFWAWAAASAFLGLGFTFFSGAVQAWLVDALRASGYEGRLEPVFAKGEMVEGVAMLGGSVAGGAIAQLTNLGVPYVLRAVILALGFVLAFLLMRDTGFTPQRTSVRQVLGASVRYGLRNPAGTARRLRNHRQRVAGRLVLRPRRPVLRISACGDASAQGWAARTPTIGAPSVAASHFPNRPYSPGAASARRWPRSTRGRCRG